MDVRVGLWRKLCAKNRCFWTVVLEKTLESPIDCKEIQPVYSKGDQSWVFFGRNDAKANSSTLATSCEELTHWKRLMLGGIGAGGGDNRGWDGWMASLTRWTWFAWTSAVDDGRGGLVRCDSWDCKELDTTERLNWTESIISWYADRDSVFVCACTL